MSLDFLIHKSTWGFVPDKDFLSTICQRSLKLGFSYPVFLIDTSHSLWNKEFKFSSWGFYFFPHQFKIQARTEVLNLPPSIGNGSHSRSRLPQSWRRVQYPQLHWKYMLSRRLWKSTVRFINSSNSRRESQPQVKPGLPQFRCHDDAGEFASTDHWRTCKVISPNPSLGTWDYVTVLGPLKNGSVIRPSIQECFGVGFLNVRSWSEALGSQAWHHRKSMGLKFSP